MLIFSLHYFQGLFCLWAGCVCRVTLQGRSTCTIEISPIQIQNECDSCAIFKRDYYDLTRSINQSACSVVPTFPCLQVIQVG